MGHVRAMAAETLLEKTDVALLNRTGYVVANAEKKKKIVEFNDGSLPIT